MLNEFYPKPKMKRRMDEGYFLSLNGSWEYEIFPSLDIAMKEALNHSFNKEIIVPYPIESILSRVQYNLKKGEALVYHKSFKFKALGSETILNFGAVDNECYVYFNGQMVTKHLGGYLPFSVDITKYLREDNELIVIVKDDLDKDYPYGKQSLKSSGIWYTKVSGIWKNVFIESYSKTGIEKLGIETDFDHQAIILGISSIDKERTITISFNNEIIKELTTTDDLITIPLDNVKLWTPEEPNLYYIGVKTSTDYVETYTSFRKINIETYNGHKLIYLNNKPYYLHGLLDQGYYKEGIFTPKSIDDVINDLTTIKRLGFNTLRKHIKVEEEYWYYLCDKLGILVIQDMVNSFKYKFISNTVLPVLGIKNVNLRFRLGKKKAKDFFINHSIETIKLLKKYNSIIMWTIFNEGWGEFDVKRVDLTLKKIDNSRLFDTCSGWFKSKYNMFDSRHVYFKEFKLKKIKKDKCLFLSEFGGYTLNIPDHNDTNKEFGYKKMESIEDFNNKILELYDYEIIPKLEHGLAGSIYTQLSDVENELNGIMTYDREIIKLDESVALKIARKLKF